MNPIIRSIGIPLLILVIAAPAMTGCSEAPPSVRVTNEYSRKANVQITQRSDYTLGIFDIQPGQTTDFQDISRGRCEATATIKDEFETLSLLLILPAESDHNYTLIITNTKPPELTFNAEEK